MHYFMTSPYKRLFRFIVFPSTLSKSFLGLFDMTTHKGFRWSTATAYLRPALSRPQKNLDVESKVFVFGIHKLWVVAVGFKVSVVLSSNCWV